ncbi:hypothetical protein [Sandaracinus amylolyticus]|uniref:hypothetical protein n=1 Tax=Sandaracinus amylolyticus TaxID=927083 RepID=UPI001F30D40A|nr:hypothetical protein [Sandaracinus amylolyticus]
MTKPRWTAGALVAAIAAGAWACGSDVVEHLGDAMVDAGESLRDGASDDADAQVTIDAECSIERTLVSRLGNDASWDETQSTNWYAEVPFPEAREGGAPMLAVLCGRVDFGSGTPCSSGWTCTGDPPLPELDCVTREVEFADGIARVYCGCRYVRTSSEPARAGMSGSRRLRARFHVR